MKQFTDTSIDGIGPGEKTHKRFFPLAEKLHFLLEFTIFSVMTQTLAEVLDCFLLLARGKERPAQIKIEDWIDDTRGMGIRGLERDKGFPAGGNPAFMLFINHRLEPAAIGENNCVVGIERHGLEQDAVGLLPLPVPEMCSRGLYVLGNGLRTAALLRTFWRRAFVRTVLFHGHLL